jgi:2-polyprenyl-3-methyl-5-hydroxy-6-metoxy-1,4-benzoquinol methylase
MNETTFDQARAGLFAQQLVRMLNMSPLALMTSIGHRTGLFDTMAQLPPATTSQIASAAGLQERYVREWLNAMVTGRVVEYNVADGTYRLPAEHATWLTRTASPKNFAVTAQFISVLGSVEDEVVAAFRQGGGVPYASYHRFHEVMAEVSGQGVVSGLIERILPLEPTLPPALTRGIDVLDLGCGRGRALLRLAESYPASRFTGYDFTEELVIAAQQEAEERGLTNVRFVVQDAATVEERNQYDLICTFDAIHDQADPARVLRNIQQALRPGGIYLMQEIAGSSDVQNNLEHPFATLLYTISCMHCMTVSLSQNGAGLGTLWGRELAMTMLDQAGLIVMHVDQLENDPLNYFCFASKGA